MNVALLIDNASEEMFQPLTYGKAAEVARRWTTALCEKFPEGPLLRYVYGSGSHHHVKPDAPFDSMFEGEADFGPTNKWYLNLWDSLERQNPNEAILLVLFTCSEYTPEDITGAVRHMLSMQITLFHLHVLNFGNPDSYGPLAECLSSADPDVSRRVTIQPGHPGDTSIIETLVPRLSAVSAITHGVEIDWSARRTPSWEIGQEISTLEPIMRPQNFMACTYHREPFVGKEIYLLTPHTSDLNKRQIAGTALVLRVTQEGIYQRTHLRVISVNQTNS